MPQYKLSYFNGRGTAEPIRYIFALKDVEYEDQRFDRVNDWPKVKSDMILGQVPVLEVDGYQLCQSYAIVRYLGREFDLYGSGNMEHAAVDAVLDLLVDFLYALTPVVFEKDEAVKAEKTKKFLEETGPTFLKQFEALLERNKSGSDYFVGKSITIADICFANMMDIAKLSTLVTLEKHPKLENVHKNITTNPKIAAWIAKRPVTDF